ncbi:hypothetical protein Ddc_12357 [Ditylenchus destructor]|nr:hypothetical protein Ddc_12357 [Ditylenchus destructor]
MSSLANSSFHSELAHIYNCYVEREKSFLKLLLEMFVPIFGLFLVLIAPGASVGLKRGSDGGLVGIPGLISAGLESKVEDFLKVLRKDNDEVLGEAEQLLKEVQVAKILELTKDLSEEFGIVQSVSNIGLYSNSYWLNGIGSPTDDVVINILKALEVGKAGLLYIPSLSAVEASAGLSSRPSRVVTNALVDSNHTVEQIWGAYNSPPGTFPNSRKLKLTLKPETHEDLFERLGGLAKAYANALNKTVQLIPLAVIDDSFAPKSSRLPVGKAYKDFAVALVEVPAPSFVNDGKLKALAALGIRINDRIEFIPY